MSKTVTIEDTQVNFKLTAGLDSILTFTLFNTDGSIYNAPSAMLCGFTDQDGEYITSVSSADGEITITQNVLVVDVIMLIPKAKTALFTACEYAKYTLSKTETGIDTEMFSGTIDIKANYQDQ